jgi:hypothetical protein
MASSHLICLMLHVLQSSFSPSRVVISVAACSERVALKLNSVPDWGAVDNVFLGNLATQFFHRRFLLYELVHIPI